MTVLTLRAPAKINLTLRVGARRADGFHDVVTLLQSIDLADTLAIAAVRGPFRLASRAPGVPEDRANLVWRAADALWRAIGRDGEPCGARVRLVKAIPVAAGLGGGSADAAAALVGLNRVWKGGLSRADLMALAATLGSDVPFFLVGGTALGAGRGEVVYPVQDLPRAGVVVVAPGFGVAAGEAYHWFDEEAVSPPAAQAPGRLWSVRWPGAPIELRNDLEAGVARRHPAIGEMVDGCLRAGAFAAAMTGSGSAVFGLFRDARAARVGARRLRRPGWRVMAARTLSRREAGRLMGL